MGEFTSYWLYQKYVSTDSGQTYVPVSPAVYSINGDGTMPLSAKSEYDEACGYVPPTPSEPLYRWVNMDISTDYICDECGNYPFKFCGLYANGDSFEIYCDGSNNLTSSETKSYSGASYTSMTEGIIGDCVEIADYALLSGATSLSSVTISDSVRTIETKAFYGCSGLTSAEIPNSVTHLGWEIFSRCSGLTSVTLSNQLTVIPISCFWHCDNLQSITIPSGVTTIEDTAFANCSGLTSVTFSQSLKTIGDQCFSRCYALRNVDLPQTVESIGNFAFAECTDLQSIIIRATTPPTLGNSVFTHTNDCPILVPAASVSAFQTANNWSTYASRIQAIS